MESESLSMDSGASSEAGELSERGEPWTSEWEAFDDFDDAALMEVDLPKAAEDARAAAHALREREELRDALIGRLLQRFFNSGANSHRKQWNTLLAVDRDQGAMGVRTRLKAEQTKAVGKDSPVVFSKLSLGLSSPSLHQIVLIVICEAPELLEKRTIAQLQLLHFAYCTEAEYSGVDVALKRQRAVDKQGLLNALTVIAEKKRKTGFSRHDPDAFKAAAKNAKDK